MKGREIKILAVALILLLGGSIFYFSNILTAKKEAGTPDVIPPLTEVSSTSDPAQAPPPALPAAKNAPHLRAAGAYLISNGESLYAVADEKIWPIASVTKLMSAMTARKLIPSGEVVIMTDTAIAAFGDSGDFKTDEKFTAGDLIQAMLVSSSNDAAEALAIHYGEAEFVSRMNGAALELGMNDTNFADVTGLSPRNLSTVSDLQILVRAIWTSDPEIFSITRLKSVTLVDINTGRSRKLLSTNAFAGRGDFLGGKTGQIPEANGNLVSIFSLPDKSSPVIVIVLGADDRFKETEKILTKL